jgi:hypothetical protein
MNVGTSQAENCNIGNSNRVCINFTDGKNRWDGKSRDQKMRQKDERATR